MDADAKDHLSRHAHKTSHLQLQGETRYVVPIIAVDLDIDIF